MTPQMAPVTYFGNFTGNPYPSYDERNGMHVPQPQYPRSRGRRGRTFHPYQFNNTYAARNSNHLIPTAPTLPTLRNRSIHSSIHAPAMTNELSRQSVVCSYWGPLLVHSQKAEFETFAKFAPKTIELLFFRTSEDLAYATALILFLPDFGLPEEIGWHTDSGVLTPTGDILATIKRGDIPLEGTSLSETEQNKFTADVKSAIERSKTPGDFNAAYTVFQNEVRYTLWKLLSSQLAEIGKTPPTLPVHLARHHELFRPDQISWIGRFIVEPKGREERRLPRLKLPTVAAPGVWDDNINTHCLWLAVHGDTENSPGVIITHTGYVDKFTVFAWNSLRRLWDSIFSGGVVDQFTKSRQKTNLTRQFITFACIPDLYEQELNQAGATIDPTRTYPPPTSTFEDRTDAAIHLAKCGFSLIDMARYTTWGQQYVCDMLNSSKHDENSRKLYADLYQQGISQLQFIHIAEGGDDRTYRLPSEFPLEAVLEQRRYRAERRAHRQYHAAESTISTSGIVEDAEMTAVTDSIHGMHMTD